MCKILKLTTVRVFDNNEKKENRKIYVNADNIVQFNNNGPDNEHRRTCMNFLNNIVLYVEETPEEIFSMINGK